MMEAMALIKRCCWLPSCLLAVWIALLSVTVFPSLIDGAQPAGGAHQTASQYCTPVPVQCGCGSVQQVPVQPSQCGPETATPGGGSQRLLPTPSTIQGVQQYPHIKVLCYNALDGHIEALGVNGHTAADAAHCRAMHSEQPPGSDTCTPVSQTIPVPAQTGCSRPQQVPQSQQSAPTQNAADTAPPNYQFATLPAGGFEHSGAKYVPMDVISAGVACLLVMIFLYWCERKATRHWRKCTKKLRRLPASLTVHHTTQQNPNKRFNELISISKVVYHWLCPFRAVAAAAAAAYIYPRPWMLCACVTVAGAQLVIIICDLIVSIKGSVFYLSKCQLLYGFQLLVQCIGDRCMQCIGCVAVALHGALSCLRQSPTRNALGRDQPHAFHPNNSSGSGVLDTLQPQDLSTSSSSNATVRGATCSSSSSNASSATVGEAICSSSLDRALRDHHHHRQQGPNTSAHTTKIRKGSRATRSSSATRGSSSSSSIDSLELVRRCISDPTDACRLAADAAAGAASSSPCALPAAAAAAETAKNADCKQQQQDELNPATPATPKPKRWRQHQHPQATATTPVNSPAKPSKAVFTKSSTPASLDPEVGADAGLLEPDAVSSRSKTHDQTSEAGAAVVSSPVNSGSSSSSSAAVGRDAGQADSSKTGRIRVLHTGTPFSRPGALHVSLSSPTTCSSSSSPPTPSVVANATAVHCTARRKLDPEATMGADTAAAAIPAAAAVAAAAATKALVVRSAANNSNSSSSWSWLPTPAVVADAAASHGAAHHGVDLTAATSTDTAAAAATAATEGLVFCSGASSSSSGWLTLAAVVADVSASCNTACHSAYLKAATSTETPAAAAAAAAALAATEGLIFCSAASSSSSSSNNSYHTTPSMVADTSASHGNVCRSDNPKVVIGTNTPAAAAAATMAAVAATEAVMKCSAASSGSSDSSGSNAESDALSLPSTPSTPTAVPVSFLMLANSSSSSSKDSLSAMASRICARTANAYIYEPSAASPTASAPPAAAAAAAPRSALSLGSSAAAAASVPGTPAAPSTSFLLLANSGSGSSTLNSNLEGSSGDLSWSSRMLPWGGCSVTQLGSSSSSGGVSNGCSQDSCTNSAELVANSSSSKDASLTRTSSSCSAVSTACIYEPAAASAGTNALAAAATYTPAAAATNTPAAAAASALVAATSNAPAAAAINALAATATNNAPAAAVVTNAPAAAAAVAAARSTLPAPLRPEVHVDPTSCARASETTSAAMAAAATTVQGNPYSLFADSATPLEAALAAAAVPDPPAAAAATQNLKTPATKGSSRSTAVDLYAGLQACRPAAAAAAAGSALSALAVVMSAPPPPAGLVSTPLVQTLAQDPTLPSVTHSKYQQLLADSRPQIAAAVLYPAPVMSMSCVGPQVSTHEHAAAAAAALPAVSQTSMAAAAAAAAAAIHGMTKQVGGNDMSQQPLALCLLQANLEPFASWRATAAGPITMHRPAAVAAGAGAGMSQPPELYSSQPRGNQQALPLPELTASLFGLNTHNSTSSRSTASVALPASRPAAAPAKTRPPVGLKASAYSSAAAAIAAIAAADPLSSATAAAAAGGMIPNRVLDMDLATSGQLPMSAMSSSSSSSSSIGTPAAAAAGTSSSLAATLNGDGSTRSYEILVPAQSTGSCRQLLPTSGISSMNIPTAAASVVKDASTNVTSRTVLTLDDGMWPVASDAIPSLRPSSATTLHVSPQPLAVSHAVVSTVGSAVGGPAQQLPQQMSGWLSVETAIRLLPNDLL